MLFISFAWTLDMVLRAFVRESGSHLIGYFRMRTISSFITKKSEPTKIIYRNYDNKKSMCVHKLSINHYLKLYHDQNLFM